MEKGTISKQVKLSEQFYKSAERVYDFGLEMFGYFQAERYKQEIRESLGTLPDFHMVYPECRHLATKSRIYRNIILGAHLIIYRITAYRIEVLDIIHFSSNIGKIRDTRKIQI